MMFAVYFLSGQDIRKVMTVPSGEALIWATLGDIYGAYMVAEYGGSEALLPSDIYAMREREEWNDSH